MCSGVCWVCFSVCLWVKIEELVGQADTVRLRTRAFPRSPRASDGRAGEILYLRVFFLQFVHLFFIKYNYKIKI